MNKEVKSIIKRSYTESLNSGSNTIEPVHILISLISDSDNIVIETLESMGYETEDLISRLEGYLRLKVKNPSLKKKLLYLNNESNSVINNTST